MNLSIIIAYKKDCEIRERVLNWNVERYEKILRGAEIIVSEDKESKKEKKWNDFCKSKYINLGVEKSTKGNLLITDADIIYDTDSVLKGLNVMNKYSCLVPFNRCVKMNRTETIKVIRGDSNSHIKPNLDNCRSFEIRGSTGCFMISKDNFYKAGGFDEKFVGWGAEDTAFMLAALTMTSKPIHKLDYEMIHLWHPRDQKRRIKSKQKVMLYKNYCDAKNNKDKMIKLINGGGLYE